MAIPTESKAEEILAPAPDSSGGNHGKALIRLVLSVAFLVLAFWTILVGIWQSWFDENAYMEHGLLVVPAAAYMAWTQRDKLKKILPQPTVWGLALVLLGAVLASLGILTQWYWLSRMAFLVSFVGCIANAYGWQMVRALSYPLATLLLMITPPTFIFERVTLSLQLLASRLGEIFLEAFGFSVLREGNILQLVGVKLSVEEACSGIRSLMAILFMCTLYNYFFVDGRTMRASIFVAAIPIAILGNACRIVATGMASQYNPSLVSGVAHETFGYVSVAIAAAGCIAAHIFMLFLQRLWWHRRA